MPIIPPRPPPQWQSHRRRLELHLQNCSNFHHLKQIHAQLLKSNLHHHPFLLPSLLSLYSSLHPQSQPRRLLHLFDQSPNPNTHLFNTLIRSLSPSSPSLAFDTFHRMRRDEVLPDDFTYSFLLKACDSSLAQVRMIHCHVVKCGYVNDVFNANALIDGYSRAGHFGFRDARQVFNEMSVRDIVSWNSVIGGLVRAGEMDDAERLFDEMGERDCVSWNTLIDGFVKAGMIDKAFGFFERMPERNVVSWATMILGCCKVGDLEMGRVLFDKMPKRNLVAWTIMISGYAEKGQLKEASSLFYQMIEAGFVPDVAAVVSILAACAESGLLGLGERIHAYIKSSKMNPTAKVCNALINMYSKCGCHDLAFSIFEGMANKNLVSWNSMIHGLAVHGNGQKALDLFVRMKREGFVPDGVTFLGVLSACAHVGLIEEARKYFTSMESDYGITPQIEHYGCMIDILGRGGILEEAFNLTRSMPMEPNAIIWGSLLGACRLHNNVTLAEEVVNKLIALEPSDAGNYAIISNIYAAAGQWDDMAKARLQMRVTGQQKQAGSSWIELDDTVHEFTVGSSTHPHADRIIKMLDRLGKHLKQVGYVPGVYS